jgi:RimJ/RimL family protein N-acetyltransferase
MRNNSKVDLYKANLMEIELVQYSKIFLELSWKWLNDDEIRRLTNTPVFSKNGQKKWYDALNDRNDYKIWGIDIDGTHIGACGLKKITKFDCEYWGYIGEKDFWGKGIGSSILNSLIGYAKNQKLTSIWLTVTADNQRAIKLYTKFGFEPESNDEINLIKMRLKL